VAYVWDAIYTQSESGDLQIFLFSLPLICLVLCVYETYLYTHNYLHLFFMDYPECETCSEAECYMNVSCGVHVHSITIPLYHQDSKYYDTQMYFCFAMDSY
jgi:hypothetical protein